MKKVFFDTNVIISSILNRDDSMLACAALSACDFHLVEGYISFLTVANTAYVIKKGRTTIEMKLLLQQAIEGLSVLSMNENQLKRAYSVEANDFEDVLQFECAKDANCDIIVTNNMKDYRFSNIEVMSTEDFANLYSLE